MDVKAPQSVFAKVSLIAFIAAVLAVASSRFTEMWHGQSFVFVVVLLGTLSVSAIAGIASLWQPTLRWVGAVCALLSLYFIWTTISGIRAL